MVQKKLNPIEQNYTCVNKPKDTITQNKHKKQKQLWSPGNGPRPTWGT